MIIPNGALANLGGSQTNNKSINLSIPADRLTPGQRSEARQIALEVLDRI
jgi:hypothetical protein